MTRQTNALTEGAFMAVIAAILGLAGIYLPLLGAVTGFLWPIPIIVLIIRYDLRSGFLSLIAALILMVTLSEPLTALFQGLRYGGMALVFGYLIKKQSAPGTTVLLGGLAAAAGTILVLFFSFLLIGGSLAGLEAEMEGTVDRVLDFYRSSGLLDRVLVEGTTEEEFRQTVIRSTRWMMTLIPGVLVFGSLVSSCINYLLARQVLSRLGYRLQAIPPFRTWQLPWYSVWGIIAGLGLALAGDFWGQSLLVAIGQNIIYVYLPILLVTGLSVAVYYYYKVPISATWKMLLVFVALINLPLTVIALILLGTFDPLFNYRKLTLRWERRE
ncbi:MAG: YybS family protein [Clostridia bacterium]|nr:YybS family protein [Clostridia bacterium]